jgi:hypothetical protein
MLERVTLSRRPSPRRSPSGFAAIFKSGDRLPKPEIGAIDIDAGFIQWAWRRLGAGMKLVCCLTGLDRNKRRELGMGKFFIFFARNPLKRLDSEKLMKTNESDFAFICFHGLAFICRDFASRLYPGAASPGLKAESSAAAASR